MKATIRKVDPTHYAVTTDTFLSDGSYLGDDWMHVCGGVKVFDRAANAWTTRTALVPHEGTHIRVGGLFRLPLSDEQIVTVESMQVGDEITQ